MDEIFNIIDWNAIVFILACFVVLWIASKIQNFRITQKRKEWKRKKKKL